MLYFSMGVQSSFGSSPWYIGSDIRLIPLGFFLFYKVHVSHTEYESPVFAPCLVITFKAGIANLL